jgi:nucleotide-binding universal stress UspA family protein
MIQKILVAVAGLGKCEQMLKLLMEIGSLQRASVTILHVVPQQVTTELMAEKLAEGGKILAEAVATLGLDPNKVTVKLEQGDPKDTVCQVAEAENADLIIMGSRGLSRLESILSNSVSQYVFQLTGRPMLLIKDDVYVKRLNRVMVGFDGSPAAKDSLKLALFMLRDLKGSQLILAQVKSDQKAADAIDNPERDPIFAPAIAAAKQEGVGYKCVVLVGNAGKQLCIAAEELNADLLMLGSPDRRPSVAKSLPDLDRLLGSSISDYVRVKAPCPVLLTRTAST